MQDEQQYRQLIMLYEQLLNGAHDISRMLDNECYDDAITMVKSREATFVNCRCILRYLELTPVQKNELDKIVNELKEVEFNNIKKLEAGMMAVKEELSASQKSQKIQQAYDNTDDTGSIINVQE